MSRPIAREFPSPREMTEYIERLRTDAHDHLLTADTIEKVRALQGQVTAYDRVLKYLSGHNRA